MCGIAGIFHQENGRQVNISELRLMANAISHRGPDGEGFFIENHVGFAHRRLSVIDLFTGNQPMMSDDKNLVIVFNGEIYNYLELREELKSFGFIFKTNSDTEVILNSYQKWGYDCQNKFNGMWAFAIWDKQKNELFISRDRIGEKPLHYAHFDNSIIFGSEIKSLIQFGIVPEPNTELLSIYLTLGYIPAPFTFFKGINKLKPGHFLIVNAGGVTINKYWDLPSIDERNMIVDKKQVYEKFEFLLKDSVRLRMRSDVPFGAFLSGGLDSASIVALMAEISSYPVETYTIGYNDRSFDESDLADLVSKKFNTNHHLKYVDEGEFDDYLTSTVFHYDEPFGDSSAIPTGKVCKYASSNLKMVLTGDGGDEVLSGYTGYQGDKFASQYKNIPSVIRNNLPWIISKSSSLLTGKYRYKLNRVNNVLMSSNLDFLDRLHNKLSWVETSKIESLLCGQKNYSAYDYLNDELLKCPYKDDFYKLMYFNLKISLPEDMLAKVDRMSMAHSLETRTPFLDHRLIEYMVGVDKNVKMQGYQRKSVLRNSVAKRLPVELLNARKKGFRVPVREWFRSPLFKARLENLVRENDFVDKKTLQTIIDENYSGKGDYGNFIWMVFVLNKWYKNNKIDC